MKYALINPNWTFSGSIYFGCREAHLPLEFGYAAALLSEAGHEVEVIDGQLHDLSLRDIGDRIQSFCPDFTVVTTAPSYLFWRCAPPELTCPQKVIDTIRPHAGTVIMVGPHGSTTPCAALRKTGADFVISGEFEEVLTEFAGPEFHSHPSVGYFEGKNFKGASAKHASNMAALPALKWETEALRLHRHHHHRFDIIAEGWGAEMETSRGCPYSCSFCAKENFRNKYRKRPLPTILQELDNLIASGAQYVYFVDEIFLPNRDLLEALKQRDIKFGVQTRIDLWDYEMLQLLGEAGCVSIEAGVESITEEGRAQLNKNCKMSTDGMTDRLVHARKYVPFVQGNLIQAGTDEVEQVENWRTYLQSNGVWANKPVPLYPYPGSPDYTRLWGMIDDLAWERAHEHYLKMYNEFSDVQNIRPLPLTALERPIPNGHKPLKVIMTCDAVGGVWTYSMDLCKYLAQQGVQVLLAVLGPEMSREQRREADQLVGVLVMEQPGKLEWMDDPWDDIDETAKWLEGLAATYIPDVVHLNGYAHATVRWGCPVAVVAHSCLFSWWKAVKGECPPSQFNRYRKEVQAALDASSVIIAPTRAVLSDLENFYTLRGNRKVIYNGRNYDEKVPGVKELFIFSAGRVWDEAKNFALLNEVAPELDWPIVVAGNSSRCGTKMELRNLELTGQLDQPALRAYYQRASIFVSAAKYEPFGLCILEAAMSACPLVLSDLDSLREVWQDNALFIEPGNHEQLHRTLLDLTSDDVLRQKYGLRALTRARQFTADRMTQEYLNLYNELRTKKASQLSPLRRQPDFALTPPAGDERSMAGSHTQQADGRA